MPEVGRHGDGSIVHRKDGRLQISITMPNGRRVYRTVPRLSDPKRQMRLAEAERRRLVAAREADLDPAGQTLEDFLVSWLASMARLVGTPNERIRANTLSGYRIIATRHVIPALGRYSLDRLSERHVQAWLDGLQMSPRYVSHCRAFLRRVLNVAYRQRIIERNPAANVELGRIPEFEGSPLSTSEAKALLAATANDRLGPLWRLAIVTGFRVSELTGLAWDDIDLDAGRVTLRSKLARRDGEWVREAPKTTRSIKRIGLDGATVAMLVEHKRRQAEARTPDWQYWGLVFTTPGGMPLDRHRVMEAFREACDRAAIARRRVHDLRGTSATLLRDIGVPEETRMARLGHATTAMSRHYAKASEEQDRLAVERLAEAIR